MNKRSGIGIQIYENWDMYDGQFDEEKGDGEGIFYSADGKKFLFEYKGYQTVSSKLLD